MILRPGAIGDFIVSLPALESLRTDYTEVWTAAPNVPLAWFADHAEPISRTGIDTFGLPGLDAPPRLLERLRSFDSIVSWYGASREDFRQAMLSLCPGAVFHQALPSGSCHATDFYLQQVGQPPGAAPSLPLPSARQDFIAIHPFSGSPRKNWPLGSFRKIASELPMEVRWTAGPEEELEDATRFANLWDLAKWLASARLYIGNDSGITHLAAAAGVPVLALFGPSDPAVWAPRGPHVAVLRNPSEREVREQAIRMMA